MSAPLPHPSRLSSSTDGYLVILAAHDRACTNGEGSYRDPFTGFTVITATAHLARGTCCNSGCRHCPYLEN